MSIIDVLESLSLSDPSKIKIIHGLRIVESASSWGRRGGDEMETKRVDCDFSSGRKEN